MNEAKDADDVREGLRLAWENYRASTPHVLVGAPIAALLIGIILGLEKGELVWALAVALPIVLVIEGFIQPVLTLRWLARRAFARVPGEAPGERLGRLLSIGRKGTMLAGELCWFLGGGMYTALVCWRFDKPPWLIGLGALVALGLGLIQAVPLMQDWMRRVQPAALRELARVPKRPPRQAAVFWPRLSWYLPYLFTVFVLVTITFCATIVGLKSAKSRDRLVRELEAEGQAAAAARVRRAVDDLGGDVFWPLLLTGGYLALTGGMGAYLLARRQRLASRAIQASLDSLLTGKPEPPEWVSTDEMGDLAFGARAFLLQLQRLPGTLRAQAHKLGEAGATLQRANDAHQQSLTRQAAALQQTQVTAQEIKQVLSITAERAGSVLSVAERAESLGKAGAGAGEQSLQGLSEIRRITEDIRGRIQRLDERARQVEDITETVKHLADQTNMLALNAAIEAVRSGEHGKGFGVVAREIRNLADQSIEANQRVREILEDIGGAIRETVAMSDQGARHIERELELARGSGEDLRELSRIVDSSAQAMRQISQAVDQQNTGFQQIFGAIAELGANMEETVQRLDETAGAAKALDEVSRQVDDVARRYAVD